MLFPKVVKHSTGVSDTIPRHNLMHCCDTCRRLQQFVWSLPPTAHFNKIPTDERKWKIKSKCANCKCERRANKKTCSKARSTEKINNFANKNRKFTMFILQQRRF